MDEERHPYRENLEATKIKKVDKKKAEYEARQELQLSEERETED